jgi:hypothetical protein
VSEFIGWVDNDGVTHIERKDAVGKPDPVQRHQATLKGIADMLNDIWATRPACATHYPKPCDCE